MSGIHQARSALRVLHRLDELRQQRISQQDAEAGVQQQPFADISGGSQRGGAAVPQVSPGWGYYRLTAASLMREGSRFCLLKLWTAVCLPQVAAGELLQGVSPRKAWDTGLPPAAIAEGRDKAQEEASDEGAAGASKEKPGALAWAAPLRRGAGPSCRQQDCNHY